MKDNIHPKYNDNVKVSCSCGNTFTTGSTAAEIKTEVCSACHPFYTGKQKIVDTARRVEKFHARVAAKKDASASRKGKKVKRAARSAAKNPVAAKAAGKKPAAKAEKSAAEKTEK
jgi:large subunit ribosomal protein L31